MSTSHATAERDAVIRMGHDIARQFAHRPREQAVEEVSAHLLKFWEPRMLAELRQVVSAGDLDSDSGRAAGPEIELGSIVADAVLAWPDEADTQADRDVPSGG